MQDHLCKVPAVLELESVQRSCAENKESRLRLARAPNIRTKGQVLENVVFEEWRKIKPVEKKKHGIALDCKDEWTEAEW